MRTWERTNYTFDRCCLILEIGTATNFSNHHSDQSVAVAIEARPSTEKDCETLKVQMIINIFSNEVF